MIPGMIRHGCGIRIPSLLLTLAVTGSALTPASAQTELQIAQCAAIDDNRRRLECFDSLTQMPQPQESPEPAVAAEQDEPGAQSPAIATTQPSEDTEAATESAAEPSRRELRRQRRAEERSQGAVTLMIVAVAEDYAGRTRFTTDAGATYLQTSTDSARYAEPPFSAELERATFGSYFLTPAGGRRVRVSPQD
jgi:hypothetical protein